RQEVEVVVVGGFDCCSQHIDLLQGLLSEALHLWMYAESETRRRLGIKIPEQGSRARCGSEVREVDGRRALADAALHVVNGDNDHSEASTEVARLNNRKKSARIPSLQKRDNSRSTCARRDMARLRAFSAKRPTVSSGPGSPAQASTRAFPESSRF